MTIAVGTPEGYAMREDTVVQLRQPGSFEDDPLTEVLRLGARRLLMSRWRGGRYVTSTPSIRIVPLSGV